MRKTIPAFILIAILLLNSCATIFYGTRQDVVLNTDLPGAQVFINGLDINKQTPCVVTINRRQPMNDNLKRQVKYEFKKENYNPVEIKDVAHKNHLVMYFSWALYLVPGIIDAITQANNIYEKSHIVKMYPIGQTIIKTDTIVKKEIVYVETGQSTPKYTFERKSDVDKNIPQNKTQHSRRFALIIGNEDYSSHQVEITTEMDVHYARNDASAFRDYAQQMFGIPERNIFFLLDVTTGQIRQAITKINAIIKSTYGEAEVFVYYAGHGLPDENTRESYLMPVDVSGKNAPDGIKLSELYQKLMEHPSKRVTVFIDACFSGGAREQGLLAARAVKVRPKSDLLSGNLVVFTASSGEQSSLPYNEQNHGLFTYFLLKAWQQNGINLSYEGLLEYL